MSNTQWKSELLEVLAHALKVFVIRNNFFRSGKLEKHYHEHNSDNSVFLLQTFFVLYLVFPSSYLRPPPPLSSSRWHAKGTFALVAHAVMVVL